MTAIGKTMRKSSIEEKKIEEEKEHPIASQIACWAVTSSCEHHSYALRGDISIRRAESGRADGHTFFYKKQMLCPSTCPSHRVGSMSHLINRKQLTL